MALKALLLRKRIDTKKKEMETLRAKSSDFETREAELEKAIAEVETDDQRAEVESMVNDFEAEKASHNETVAKLEREIGELEKALEDEEKEQETAPPAGADPVSTRKDNKIMAVRDSIRDFYGMTLEQRNAFIRSEDVQAYLGEVRAAIKEKRALTNVGLTIPEVMLGLLRQNIEDYSKIYKHVAVRRIGGDGRMVIMGAVPEAIWTECCANLNELSLRFNDVEVDCFKVGGYFAVCNATIEDSDLNLVSELMTALGQAIGLALDKAILYGRNASGTQYMPQGIVSRLVQTEAPSGYPSTARPWVDLHTSNVLTISAANSTGIKLFQNIVTSAAAAKGKYARNGRTWVMNENTYTKLVTEAMSINATGAVVSGMGGTMPVLGGAVEILDFIPDNVIIGGYFEDYILAERAGQKFATSEHVRFIQDQTVIRGTARYDGVPAIAEAFVAIGINAAVPNATMTFAS